MPYRLAFKLQQLLCYFAKKPILLAKKSTVFTINNTLIMCFGTLLAASSVIALSQERWFQIEISIFSNESPVGKSEELWQPARQQLAFPEKMRKLDNLIDILMLDSFNSMNQAGIVSRETAVASLEQSPEQREEIILTTGPQNQSINDEFRFFDFSRDDFLQLPPSSSDFQQTNRELERSPDHRLLFHGLWRQVVTNPAFAEPIYVEGGLAYGAQHELQGSLTIRFNEGQDRIVVDANLWFSEFSVVENLTEKWELPAPPKSIANFNDLETSNPDLIFHPIRVYHMQQTRDMRSQEFHYLDHPALGLVILVQPYEIPNPISNNSNL